MLKIKNLRKKYRGVVALANISFDLAPGKVLAIVGDNGAGKSTLMKCISGAVSPDAGSIIYKEKHISHTGVTERRLAGIEMIYQDWALCPLQNVLTNVFLGREKKRGIFLDRRRMAEDCIRVFAELGLSISNDAIVGSLSGGQQQSVAIARAMVANPSLLVMDEPTAALGVKEVQRVLEQITVLKKKGVSVILVTHRLADIFEIADRIIVMNHGAVRFDLSPSETSLADLSERIVAG